MDSWSNESLFGGKMLSFLFEKTLKIFEVTLRLFAL